MSQQSWYENQISALCREVDNNPSNENKLRLVIAIRQYEDLFGCPPKCLSKLSYSQNTKDVYKIILYKSFLV